MYSTNVIGKIAGKIWKTKPQLSFHTDVDNFNNPIAVLKKHIFPAISLKEEVNPNEKMIHVDYCEKYYNKQKAKNSVDFEYSIFNNPLFNEESGPVDKESVAIGSRTSKRNGINQLRQKHENLPLNLLLSFMCRAMCAPHNSTVRKKICLLHFGQYFFFDRFSLLIY